jgi:cell wall-associated NlpC family hydrolase
VKKDETIDADVVFKNTISGKGLVKAVLGFNGIPYLWGGASSKALDCSGLTSNVFFMNGTLLPRDADQQSLCGVELTTTYDFTLLETGDLLFFGRKATADRPESVTHVALYLGDTEFIHSAGYRDRVSINSMDSTRANFIPTYPDIFIRATRISGKESQGVESIAENAFYKEIIKNPPIN